MVNKLLLLEDVDNVGRKGDIVSVKPGFARNFLLPQKKAFIADKNVIKIQMRLKSERETQSVVDKEEASVFAEKIKDIVLEVTVKTDPEGHMYGSVSAADIAKLLFEKGLVCDRRMVVLPHALKTTGEYKINLKLKEGVIASCLLKVISENYTQKETITEIVESGLENQPVEENSVEENPVEEKPQDKANDDSTS